MSRIIINKKKVKVNLVLKILLFIITVIFILTIIFYLISFNFKINSLSNYIYLLSKKYDYLFTEIEINGLKNISEIEINKYFNKYYNKSIFLIPIKEISQKIEKNNWIEIAKLKSNYKNKISIYIKEFEPIAVYFNGKQYIFINKSGRVIDFVNEKTIQQHIILYGENANIKGPALVQSIPNELKLLIIKAEYINNRRWDIYIKKNLKIKLPENGYKKAMNFFIDIYVDLHSSDISNIEYIDLRISEKALIKFYNKNINFL